MNKKIYLGLSIIILGIFFFKANAQQLRGEKNMALNDDVSEKSPFGVLEFLHWNHPWNNYKYPDKKSLEKIIALMKETGVAWVRMDFLWDEIEPEDGKFEFSKYDAIVDLLVKNNINILGLLDYSAPWASSCGQWNCAPKDNKLFVDYAVGVVRHYRGKIIHWEVWNEPDSRTYWQEQDGLKSYCVLLKDVYLAVKKAVPDCKILNGGLANGVASVNHLYDNGAKDYFDILNIHIFESPLNRGSINGVASYPKLAHKIMARNGDGNKKIWVTEIGCPGVKGGQKINNWWMGKNPDEKQQAKWLKDIYAKLLENPSVDKVFWAFFRDCKGHWGNGVDYFGLVRWDFSKKPAFFSYQKRSKNFKK